MSETPMAGLTALLNPLAAKKDRVILFCTAKNYTLEYEHRSLKQPASSTTVVGSAGTAKTLVVKNPSSLVAMVYDDMVHVYGIDGENNVSQVSPVYSLLPGAVTGPTSSLGGCSNGQNEGWLYYLVEDAEKKKTMINEWTLSSGSSLSLSLNTDVYPKTYLAAFFDGESHYVIYQTVNGKICVWNVSSGKDTVIKGSEDSSKMKTPLATCFVPGNGTEVSRYYVYHVSEKNEIWRCVATKPTTSSTLDFADPKKVTEAEKVAEWTQMSVVVDEDQRSNLIYCLTKKGQDTKYNAIRDPWMK